MDYSNNNFHKPFKRPVFTKDNFFNDKMPFADKKKFIKQINQLKPYDRVKVQLFFNQLHYGFQPIISLKTKFNRNTMMSYYHVKYNSEDNIQGYMLPKIEGMDKLIDVYNEGYCSITLNLDDLCESELNA